MTIIEQLTRDEGLRLKPYHDSVGKLTIGIGRNLDDVGISQDEAELLLVNDIAIASRALTAAFPWTSSLDPARLGVLLNMTFNMGIAKLSQFKNFLTRVRTGDYSGAANAMLDSLWAHQVSSRAQRLSTQMRTGVWQ